MGRSATRSKKSIQNKKPEANMASDEGRSPRKARDTTTKDASSPTRARRQVSPGKSDVAKKAKTSLQQKKDPGQKTIAQSPGKKSNSKSQEEMPYKCALCGKQFLQSGKLDSHMKAAHKGAADKAAKKADDTVNVFLCKLCPKTFDKKNKLMAHVRQHDDNETSEEETTAGSARGRDFQCHLCDKAYPRADTLKRHILSFHENKRLYKCDVCGKSFKGHIRDHMRTHAGEKEDKPYGCHQCGARFNQRSQLTVHMRVHTGERPYCCKICSRSFSHSTALKLHLRMHTGEKPHSCKLCKKSFAQLPHLKKHMLCVHNTDRPYYCECCENFFKIKNDYLEHVDKVHPDRIPEDLVGVTVIPAAEAEAEVIKGKESATSGGTSSGGRKSGRKTAKSAKTDTTAQLTTQTTVSETVSSNTMPTEKIRTLLALLLKKISTPGRLKKLGFGTRLIDDVLKESITASGRVPIADKGLSDRDLLIANIKILLDWTIPEEYINYFKAERKSVEEILEELAA